MPMEVSTRRSSKSSCWSMICWWNLAELSRVRVKQDVAEGGARRRFHLDHARPARGIDGGPDLSEAVAVAGAAGEDEFAVGGEFEQRAVREVGAGAMDFEG